MRIEPGQVYEWSYYSLREAIDCDECGLRKLPGVPFLQFHVYVSEGNGGVVEICPDCVRRMAKSIPEGF